MWNQRHQRGTNCKHIARIYTHSLACRCTVHLQSGDRTRQVTAGIHVSTMDRIGIRTAVSVGTEKIWNDLPTTMTSSFARFQMSPDRMRRCPLFVYRRRRRRGHRFSAIPLSTSPDSVQGHFPHTPALSHFDHFITCKDSARSRQRSPVRT